MPVDKEIRRMKRIVLGKTGLEINRMGFGGIPIQRVKEKEAIGTVLHAINEGVDFIDTSRAYNTSERRIGRALKETDKKVVIASKSQSKSADGLFKDLETSLKELQVDYIDLYQAHFVRDEKDYRGIIGPKGALEGLMKAKSVGLIGHIGLTSHSLDLLDIVIAEGLFETIMVCFSFLEPVADQNVIPKALAKNIGVIAMKSFSGGMIDNSRLAIKFALSRPGVVLIPGVENKDLFNENWKIFESGDWNLTPGETEEIAEIRKMADKQFCRRCDYCQPCSANIPIQHILGIKSIVKRMGPDVLELGWIKSSLELALNCTQCGECLARCPYGLPIPELIQENIKWVNDRTK
jgi:uncharacterized protein